MLTYLILTTRQLLMGAVILGLVNGFTNNYGNKTQRKIVFYLTMAGVAASVIVAYFRNATSKLDSAILNGYIYTISLVSFVLYLIFKIKFINERLKISEIISCIMLGLINLTVMVYALPEVIGYPYHIYLSEKTIISTDYLLSIIGIIFGLILMVVIYLAARKSVVKISKKEAELIIVLELILNAAIRVSGLYSVLFQKKIIKSNHYLFNYTVFVKNNSDYFIFSSLLLLVLVAVVLIVRSLRQNEPYTNPAEHRKIRAKWRNIRRWATTAIVCAVLGVCNLTVVEAINTTDVTLSPIEDATAVDSENVYVDFSLVNDGHLHRFAYETENGVAIRFIVIQKSGNSYGIGLDACDVCGETGYYEKDGQVVCNLCDVVMNISTIGFKGGCNPIVIPYEIEGGQIIVPISGLLDYESEFK